MNPPAPPTDNFYKFLAVAGLICTAFFLVAPFYRMMKENEIAARAGVEIKHVSFDLDYYINTRNVLRETVKQAEAKHTLSLEEIARLKDDRVRLDLLEERVSKLMEHNTETGKELAASQARLKSLESYEGHYIIFLIIGLCATVIGFVLWKTRHQDFQDRLLVAEVKLKEATAYLSLNPAAKTPDETTKLRAQTGPKVSRRNSNKRLCLVFIKLQKALQEYWNAVYQNIIPGFAIAFFASSVVWLVKRFQWNAHWATPAKTVLGEHFAPNSIVCLLALADIAWGFWYLFTFRKDQHNLVESKIYKYLTNYTNFVVSYVALAIGLLAGIFLKQLLLQASFEWRFILGILLLLATACLLFFFNWFNDQKREGNRFIIVLFGTGLIFQAIYFYLNLVVHPINWAVIETVEKP